MERKLKLTGRVLVTGATGFLGGALVRTLVSMGHSVTAIGRNKEKGLELTIAGAQFVCADFSDRELLIDTAKNHEAVVHCGALSSPWGKPADFEMANVQGTANVIEACLKNQVRRLVHISTPSVYVEARDRLGILETDPLPLVFMNDYARTKRQAEVLVEAAGKSGLETIILRPQGIIGPGDTSILPRLVRVAEKGFFPVIRTDQVVMDLTAVENVVEAILCALDAGSIAIGKVYNITNGESDNNLKIIDFVLKRLGISYRRKFISLNKAWLLATGLEWFHRNFMQNREPLLTRYSVCALGFSRTLSIARAEKELGYHPWVKLFPALEKAVDAYKMQGKQS